jgi:hypothetical protein
MNIFLSHGTGGAVCLAHAPVPLCRPILRALAAATAAGRLIRRLLDDFCQAYAGPSWPMIRSLLPFRGQFDVLRSIGHKLP